MRIASLIPSATELLFELGLGDQVIGVTHECDYPPAALGLPQLTRSVIDGGLAAAAIDSAVRELTLAGEAIYELDEEELAGLEPDLIVTQALCGVCAVAFEDVVAVAETMRSRPQVISLDPRTLGEVLGDVRTLAEATNRADAGLALVQDAAWRVDRVRHSVRTCARPRVAALEWLDPPFAAGHWTPQLIDYAGGEDALGMPGEHSRQCSWEEIAAAAPEIVVVMPCGYDTPRAREEALAQRERLAGLGAADIVAVDASAYFSRPGPRLIDGLELLAHILHPDRFPDTPGGSIPVVLR